MLQDGRMSDLLPPTECWIHEDVEVTVSEVEGRGLLARVPIASRTSVVRLGGRLVSEAELRALFRAAEKDPEHPYVDCITVDDDRHLIIPPGQDVHFGNHSCDPNLWHVDAFTLATRRDVHAGEELTVDYATQTADPDFRMTCRCGSELCRGVVTGEDWLRPELQRRYGDHWVPALRKRIARERDV